MNRELVDKIARAVLYEGYILYPYRRSVKNRHRWTFGGIYPKSYCDSRGGADACVMQTQCLVRVNASSAIECGVRFLQLCERAVEQLDSVSAPAGTEPSYRAVHSLQIGNRSYQPWQEAIEREIDLGQLSFRDLIHSPRKQDFCLTDHREEESLEDESGVTLGRLVRRRKAIHGSIETSVLRLAEDLYRLTVRIENASELTGGPQASRDNALLQSLVSTHTILGIADGAFISLTDPPEALRESASRCENIGCWPVLIGEAGQADTILSSPIILYDYPQLAPESPGDLFDATEIDEILTLRIMTLTDDEKREAAAVDERVGAMLVRTENLAREQLMNLHGAVRGLKPSIKTQVSDVAEVDHA